MSDKPSILGAIESVAKERDKAVCYAKALTDAGTVKQPEDTHCDTMAKGLQFALTKFAEGIRVLNNDSLTDAHMPDKLIINKTDVPTNEQLDKALKESHG